MNTVLIWCCEHRNSLKKSKFIKLLTRYNFPSGKSIKKYHSAKTHYDLLHARNAGQLAQDSYEPLKLRILLSSYYESIYPKKQAPHFIYSDSTVGNSSVVRAFE